MDYWESLARGRKTPALLKIYEEHVYSGDLENEFWPTHKRNAISRMKEEILRRNSGTSKSAYVAIVERYERAIIEHGKSGKSEEAGKALNAARSELLSRSR